jgi:hypothetical protein
MLRNTSDEEIKRVCDRLESSDPEFDDCADAVRLIIALQLEREASADWKARAIEERQRRVAAESREGGSVENG